jgi:hypothetical protein
LRELTGNIKSVMRKIRSFLTAGLVGVFGGTAIGVLYTLPLKKEYRASFKIKLATVNDGVVAPSSLISTKPIASIDLTEIRILMSQCEQSHAQQTQGTLLADERIQLDRGMPDIVSLAVRGSTEEDARRCAVSLVGAVVESQNVRLSEYTLPWVSRVETLNSQIDRELLEAKQISQPPFATTQSALLETYKLHWLLASATKANQAAAIRINERLVSRPLYLHGVFGGAIGLALTCGLWCLYFVVNRRTSMPKFFNSQNE